MTSCVFSGLNQCIARMSHEIFKALQNFQKLVKHFKFRVLVPEAIAKFIKSVKNSANKKSKKNSGPTVVRVSVAS